jgi:hypothetical protein
MNLSKNVKKSQILGYFAAGTTARTTSIVDMEGYEGVTVDVLLGTVTEASVVTVKLQHNDVNSTTGMADITGATVSFTAGAADSNKMVSIDLYKPVKPFIQAVVTPATQNAVICGAVATKYSGKKQPPATQDATFKASKFLVG